MCEIYKTGVTHKPSFVNAIFEEAYAMAQMSEADGEMYQVVCRVWGVTPPLDS
jgi:hypothetical protein